MNKEKLKQELQEKISGYQNAGIFFHPKFIKEIHILITKNADGSENEILKKIIIILENVKRVKTKIHLQKDHEMLKNYAKGIDCYSLHLKTKQVNFRFLMTFSGDKEPLFLVAFNEKKGKSDYCKQKEVFVERYNDWKEGDYE